jgi:hypothetical protein
MDNAKYYVQHYQDILLDQTSQTFLHDMEEVFLSLHAYKKPQLHQDIFADIQQAKKLIIEELLR